LTTWPSNPVIPKEYEREIIDLAREPSSDLMAAFRSLDKERVSLPGGNPSNDPVWLTGTLITILAFDCPPITKKDNQTWYQLKSRLYGPDDMKSLSTDPASGKILAEWPWRNRQGAWHLESIGADYNGTSDGALAPRFEHYLKHFKLRYIPVLDQLGLSHD
jgi:hypothetical protein